MLLVLAVGALCLHCDQCNRPTDGGRGILRGTGVVIQGHRIEMGMDYAKIEAALGRPDRVTTYHSGRWAGGVVLTYFLEAGRHVASVLFLQDGMKGALTHVTIVRDPGDNQVVTELMVNGHYIAAGMSYAEVIRVLGEPNHVSRGEDSTPPESYVSLTYSGDPDTKRLYSLYFAEGPAGPLTHLSYGIGY